MNKGTEELKKILEFIKSMSSEEFKKFSSKAYEASKKNDTPHIIVEIS